MLNRLINHRLSNLIFFKKVMTHLLTSFSFEYSTCLTTLTKDEDARRLARSLVENQLAACVDILPGIQSIYQWKSAIQEDQEILLIIKTRKELVQKLIDFVRTNHPYEVPELIELPINNGNPDYLHWLDQSVQKSSV